MGTTLTGTTPQDTYDSLIKVTDNGPLSGTAKYLSDGLGNDSILALSTARVGIGETSPTATLNIKSTASNNSDNLAQVLTNSEFRLQYRADDVSSLYIGGLGSERGFLQGVNGAQNAGADISLNPYGGNVGIGTSSPETKLNLVGGNIRLNTGSGTVGTSSSIEFSASTNNSVVSAEIKSTRTSGSGADLKFFTTTSVGLSPTEKLSILDGGGITFNGDTAQANALDDYEEGTWTPVLTFSGGGIDSAYAVQQGKYTKIGRQVTCVGYIALTSKGISVGNATVQGLPFTIANTDADYGGVTLANISGISFADIITAYGIKNSTTFRLFESTNAGVQTSITNSDFTNSAEFIFTYTYNVS